LLPRLCGGCTACTPTATNPIGVIDVVGPHHQDHGRAARRSLNTVHPLGCLDRAQADGESVQPKFGDRQVQGSDVRRTAGRTVGCRPREPTRLSWAFPRSAPGSDEPICSTSAYETEAMGRAPWRRGLV
jgi:hypothetical protein